jgi:hypothetical protein
VLNINLNGAGSVLEGAAGVGAGEGWRRWEG